VRRHWSFLIVLSLWAGLPAGVRGESAAGTDAAKQVARAVEAYRTGLDTPERDERLDAFRRSVRLFAAAAAEGGGSADLYANLGNAALQAEDLGTAVLAYRRALVLDPDNSRARHNLEHARSLAPDWLPRREEPALLGSFFYWHRTLAPAERMRIAALCFALAGVLVAVSIRFRSNSARNLAILPALAWIALTGSLALDPADRSANEGVVTAPEAVARSADSVNAPPRFAQPLPMGTELRVLERRDDWVRVALANGREAWVRSSSVTSIAPSDD
jgi:tetratricopeptide (TPR) repeat protein